ncbi:MAG: 5'-nucleotidase C-terminal domain-containing protein [bacterium]
MNHFYTMKKAILTVVTLFLLAYPLYAELVPVTILYTNDLHGHILPSYDSATEGEPKPLMGGLSRHASYIKAIRTQRKDDKILLLDSGDFFHGTVEGNSSQGRAIIEAMNIMGYDALSLGNHDFAFGEENLARLAKEAGFHFLGANITKKDSTTHPQYLKPYMIKKSPEITIVVIGVITPETISMNFYDHVKGIDILNPAKTVARHLNELQDKNVDLIILVSHLGHREDMVIAECFPQVDVIIGGHDHVILESPREVGDTLVCQAGENGYRVGNLELVFDTDTDTISAYEHTMANIYTDSYTPDPQTETALKRYYDKDMDQIIGYAKTTLRNDSAADSPLGNWITDVMREEGGADIAIASKGGIRASLAKGDITKRELYSISPFENTLVRMNISGKNLKILLERMLSKSTPRFHVSGLKIEFDPKAQQGKRITRLSVGDNEVIAKEEYTLIMNNFEVFSVGRYKEIKDATQIKDTKITLYQALADYTKKHSPVAAPQGKRIIASYKNQEKKININTATEEELCYLKGIGPKKAGSIIEHRKKHGHFANIEGIMEVKGIGSGIYTKIKKSISVSGE